MNNKKVYAIKPLWMTKFESQRVIHLNKLHEVKLCGQCRNYMTRTSKCIMKNMIVNSDSEICDEVYKWKQ